MTITSSIWQTKYANFVMGASIATLGAIATPTVRERIHEALRIEEENQVIFDTLVVGAVTIFGLYGLYQRGRRDAANFILDGPEKGVETWFIMEGGSRKKPKYAWRVMSIDPKVVIENA